MSMTFRIDNALIIAGFKGTYEELDSLIEEAPYTGFTLQLGVLPTKENNGTNKGFISIKNKLSDTTYNLDVRTTLVGIHFPDILVLGLNSTRPVIKKPAGLTATVEDLHLAIKEYKNIVRSPITSISGKHAFIVPGKYEAFVEETPHNKKGDAYVLKGSMFPLSIHTNMFGKKIETEEVTPAKPGQWDSAIVIIEKYIVWKFDRRFKRSGGYKVFVCDTFEDMMKYM